MQDFVRFLKIKKEVGMDTQLLLLWKKIFAQALVKDPQDASELGKVKQRVKEIISTAAKDGYSDVYFYSGCLKSPCMLKQGHF